MQEYALLRAETVCPLWSGCTWLATWGWDACNEWAWTFAILTLGVAAYLLFAQATAPMSVFSRVPQLSGLHQFLRGISSLD